MPTPDEEIGTYTFNKHVIKHPKRSERVWKALLQMKKIDIQALQEAAGRQ